MSSPHSPVASQRLWFERHRGAAKGRDRDLGSPSAVRLHGESAIPSYGDNFLPLSVRTRHGVEDSASAAAYKQSKGTDREHF